MLQRGVSLASSCWAALCGWTSTLREGESSLPSALLQKMRCICNRTTPVMYRVSHQEISVCSIYSTQAIGREKLPCTVGGIYNYCAL